MKPIGEQIVGLVHRIVRPLQARMDTMILRAVLRSVDDGAGFQVLELGALGEGLAGAEHLQPGGLTHVPVAGAEGLQVSPSGRRGHAVGILIANRALRPKGLAPGETGLWTALAGANGGLRVRLKADGTVWIGSQDPVATDFVALAAKVLTELSAIKTAFDTHTHTVPIVGAAGTTPSTPPVAPMPAPSSVASTHTKGS